MREKMRGRANLKEGEVPFSLQNSFFYKWVLKGYKSQLRKEEPLKMYMMKTKGGLGPGSTSLTWGWWEEPSC